MGIIKKDFDETFSAETVMMDNFFPGERYHPTVEAKKTAIIEAMLNEPTSGEDIMDLEAPDRISLQDMGRSEREKNKRLAFLYE